MSPTHPPTDDPAPPSESPSVSPRDQGGGAGRATSGWNVLITARAFHDSGQEWWQKLEQAGCSLRKARRWGPLSIDELAQECQDIDAVIAATDPYQDAFFARAKRLKLVARCGIGIDSVDLVSASRHGVLVTNVPHAMTDAVADYCFALLLGLVRRIPEGDACMRRGGWEEYPGVELRGKRLGLIGFGKIGQEVARRAFGFGLEVVTHDPNWNPELEAIGSSMAAGNSVRSVDLETLLRTSRFVSLHAPNIPQTRHLINAQRLSLMRPDAYLINTSRGALIDEQALREALLEGRIAGAAIDVYQQEPLPADHPLRQTPRLLLTPHNAFNAREAAERMSEGCALPILDLLQGRRPQFVCNPDGWEPCMSKTSLSGGVIGCE